MNAALDALAVGLSDSVKQSIEDAICSAERARVEREILALYVDCPPDHPDAQQLDGRTVAPIYGCDTLECIMDILRGEYKEGK